MAGRRIWGALTALLLLLAVSGVVAGEARSRRPKNVKVSLRAKWAGTPLLLEASELLSKEQKNFYWEFVDRWAEPDRASDCSDARCCVQKIVEDARSVLSDPLGSIFELSLTLRSASPRLVLYRQLAEESLSSFADDKLKEVRDESIGGIDHNHAKTADGLCCWVDTGSKKIFSVKQFLRWLESSEKVSSLEQPELYDFDHVFSRSSTSAPAVVLYGAVGTDCFKEFHTVLLEASKMGKVKYALRMVLSAGCQSSTNYCSAVGAVDPVTLGGYGVELALKNMEYKAMDDTNVNKGVPMEDPRTEDLTQEVKGFIFSKILERKPKLTDEIMAFRDYLLSSSISDTLEVWELKDLGHQTAQRIVQSSEPLQLMQEISQNFPNVVSSLSRIKLNNSIKDEILANQRMVPPGKSLMALNGALVNLEDLDLYLLMDLIHEEMSLSDQFARLKMPSRAIKKILSAPPPVESTSVRVDYRSSHVHYLNNLEEDPIYRRWRSNINEILIPVFPGQLRYIRKNLFHAVYVFDPSTECGAEIIDMILSMYQDNVPMRFGVILYSSKFLDLIEGQNQNHLSSSIEEGSSIESDISSMIIRIFLYIKEKHTTQLAFQFLSNMYKLKNTATDLSEESLKSDHVEGAFVDTVLPTSKAKSQDMLHMIKEEEKYKEESEGSSRFVYQLGLFKLKCCLLMNGLVYQSPSEGSTMNAMHEELPRIQEQVYYGLIDSYTDVLEKFLSESGYKRYNPLVISSSKGNKKIASLIAPYLDRQSLLHKINYLHSRGTTDNVKPVTHHVVVDVASRTGLNLLLESLRYMISGSEKARIGYFIYASNSNILPSLYLKKFIDKALSSFSTKEKVLEYLLELCVFFKAEDLLASSPDDKIIALISEKAYELAGKYGLSVDSNRETLNSFSLDNVLKDLDQVSDFLFGTLELEPGANIVLTNGKIFNVHKGLDFLSDDIGLLESVEYEQRIKFIAEIIDEVEWTDVDPDDLTSRFYSDVMMLVSSAMSARERGSDRAHFEILNAEHSAIILNNMDSPLHIDAVIDPLSAAGQKLSPILRLIWKLMKPSMRIVLNPVSSLADLPLKNFYRFVLPSMDDFSTKDYSVVGPQAFFSNMPMSKTLTMNIDVPEPWLVEPVVAIHDLDNILLENLGDLNTLQAVFELEALLLTGHCVENDHDPPRGLQLFLGTKESPHIVDTLVMANLGYWQMKVSPGVWYLQLAPGRSDDLYMLMETDSREDSAGTSKLLAIDSLRGKLMHIEVKKKKGKEHEDLLVVSDESYVSENMENRSWNSNILRWASGFINRDGLSGKKTEKNLDMVGTRHGVTINIFSVASGHLYERFLKIMILSVLKNTHRPVKFWFIKNYLSPQFKDLIPYMAHEYGFEYELITYKWPTWLHKQKEKQRIIWAYKILFLDVIFPLSLKKVIFVDADQVVRADMGELYDMNIKGRPLAYTPFCDNNKEMDGYRFWKQGFWKDHLRGRPYHISALYVVDLVKFRQTAAGDNLRVFYETLSKDPNSLSNLDQDLPNYAQHTVPIFSLPQEWLWCESWCGNTTKAKAKTIDLCNNPMTKEPKLQGAKRIVSEWVGLDSEAREFTSRILGEQLEPLQATPTAPPSTDSKLENSEVKDEL